MSGATNDHDGPFDPASITRPDDALLRYYIIVSLLTVVAFPFVVIPMLAKFYTLRYQFDDEGVSMAWGVLFKREINLTYRRIQDIHITENIVQRYMGLATVSIQTASGSAGPEMQIEGILQPKKLRDFLYGRMRGARGDEHDVAAPGGGADETDEVLRLLIEIRDGVRALRPGGEG